MLHTMHDSELVKHYTLDGAGIMFVTDLIRDTLTSPTLRRNAIAPVAQQRGIQRMQCIGAPHIGGAILPKSFCENLL